MKNRQRRQVPITVTGPSHSHISASRLGSAMAASASHLSSVVSKLTRASFGAAVSSDVKDTDLDRYVADLIMKEAKSSEERYKGKEGIRAYLPTGL